MTHDTGFGALVYDGAMPANRWSGIPSGAYCEAFIYVIYGSCDRPLYVGKSRTPGQRFDRHMRKPWWPMVESVRIYSVTGDTRFASDRAALAAETRAIAELDPIFNRARVSSRWPA